MRIKLRWVIILFLAAAFAGGSVYAEDMRAAHEQARETKRKLLEQAAAEKQEAEAAAAESRKRIVNDREALENAVKTLTTENERFEKGMEAMEAESRALEQKERDLAARLDETDSMIRELVGVIRVSAKDINALIDRNPQSALVPLPDGFLEAIASQSQFPAMEDVQRMADLLFDQIRSSGEVSLQKGPLVNRSGEQIEADILMLGVFTGAYRTDGEIGFLNYTPTGRKLFALSRLPSAGIRERIAGYMKGQSEAAPIDISRGAALRQLVHELSLWEQIPKGGPLVWPILTILGLGIIIIIERVVFLLRRRFDADGLLSRIETLASARKWQECAAACARYARKPVARVMSAGLDARDMSREEMENALQEAILRETPPMERFLSTLGMLAAIAPLLGLLGTVTGMINTFHVITLYGTGDPRMMSGGISEALVTTMLGLSVAIPLLLAHTLLNRSVDNVVGQMEEKAVALVNIAHKNRAAA